MTSKKTKLTQYGRYYDYQRKKFYAWEKTLYQANLPKHSLQDLAKLLSNIIHAEGDVTRLPRRISLKANRSQKFWGNLVGRSQIQISYHGMYQATLIHELAHLFNPPPSASHGYEFLMTYIYLQTKYNQAELKLKTFSDLLQSAQDFGLTTRKIVVE